MRILSLGWTFAHDDVVDGSFRSRASALDFDVVFWSPQTVVSEYQQGRFFKNRPSLTDNESAAAIRDVQRRRSEFEELLRLGRSVVIVTTPPQDCFIDSGKREYSGTGRNRQTSRLVTSFDFLNAIPTDVSTVDAVGEQLAFVGSEPLDAFWRANRDFFHYQAYFEDPPGVPWATVEGTDRVVASLVTNDSGGHILFVPALIDAEDSDDPDLLRNERTFIESLQDLINSLKAETGEFAFPGWAHLYLSPPEVTAQEGLSDAQARLSEAEAELSAAQALVEDVSQTKLLVTGTGRALELEVADVFKRMGCAVEEGEPGRDDLIVKKDSRVAVVEVKGVTGSGAEKHVAQLEKWASNHYEREGGQPKPILVVNAFRDQPLHERSSEVFPDQLLDYAQARGHCLVTGIQMLGIRLRLADHPQEADELFDSLFKCVGRYDRFSDWAEFLSRELEEPVSTEEVAEAPVPFELSIEPPEQAPGS